MGDSKEATAAELQAAVLNLAAVIETETKWWRDATAAYLSGGWTPEQKAEMKALLDDANTARQRRVDEIRALADQCPTDVLAKLYHAAIILATGSGDGVSKLLAEAAAIMHSGVEGEPPIIDDLVTLDQVAPLTGLSKRSLERYLKKGDLPKPSVQGGGGKAHKWYWGVLREPLSKITGRPLPERFPGTRIV